MKHATAVALDRLEPLLSSLRKLDGLRERSRGTFYWKSKAFLHFHEDPAGLFADLKVDGDWLRLEVNTAAQRRGLVRTARATIAR
jgi:hypothetical protein